MSTQQSHPLHAAYTSDVVAISALPAHLCHPLAFSPTSLNFVYHHDVNNNNTIPILTLPLTLINSSPLTLDARTASQADVCELIRKLSARLSVATSVIAELETANRALVAANRQLMASALSPAVRSAVRASTLITSRKRRRQPDADDVQDDCGNGHLLDAKKHKPLS